MTASEEFQISPSAAACFFCFLFGGPSFSSQAFLRLSISPFLILSTSFLVSSGMTESTPYRSAITGLTVHGEATAASRSTQSRMKRRRMDFEKESRSRLGAGEQELEWRSKKNVPHHTTLNLEKTADHLALFIVPRHGPGFVAVLVLFEFEDMHPVVVESGVIIVVGIL